MNYDSTGQTEKLPGYTATYKPEFFSTATDFRVILKNVNYNMCDASVHDAAHDTSVISKQNLLLEFCADPKSRDEMQAYIDVSSRSHFSKYYFNTNLFFIIFCQFTPSLDQFNFHIIIAWTGEPIGAIFEVEV